VSAHHVFYPHSSLFSHQAQSTFFTFHQY
jgi:hypothetical protein